MIKLSNGHILDHVVASGGGGVSGKPAQRFNWQAVYELVEQKALPVIAPSVMNYRDVWQMKRAGARAISYGAIHLRTPWRPTAIVRKEKS